MIRSDQRHSADLFRCWAYTVGEYRKQQTQQRNSDSWTVAEKVKGELWQNEEETECFCFLAGHESFAAAEGYGIAEEANKFVRNHYGERSWKDAAQIISVSTALNVETEYDPYKEVKEVFPILKVFIAPTAQTVPEGGSCGALTFLSQVTPQTRHVSSIRGTCSVLKLSLSCFRQWYPMAAGPASYGMTDTLGRMHSVPSLVLLPYRLTKMMGLIGGPARWLGGAPLLWSVDDALYVE